MAGQPLERSIKIVKMLQALTGMGLQVFSKEHTALLKRIPQYFSRGKSGKKARNKSPAHMANVRASIKKHNVDKRR